MRASASLSELTMFVKVFKSCFIPCVIVLQICLINRSESIYVQTVVTSFRPPQQSPHQQQNRQQQQQPHHDQHKYNSITDRQVLRHAPPVFKDDAEISRYVKLHGVEFIVWRCKNAIQPAWLQFKPLPFIDLYCEVIGTMKSVAWFHNNKKVVTTAGEKLANAAKKYSHSIQPHFVDRQGYFSRWIEFTLTIHNATRQDAGLYAFQVTGPSGYTQKQHIYIDLPPPEVNELRLRRQRQRRGRNQRAQLRKRQQRSRKRRPNVRP